MKPQTATVLVIGGVGTAVITSVIKEVTGPSAKRAPAIYIPIGGVLASVPLLILADVEPGLAGMLGALIGLGALLLNSSELSAITNAINPNTKLPPPPPKVKASSGSIGSSLPLTGNSGAQLQTVMSFVQNALGTPYGTGPGRFGPSYFDCSGLIYAAYKAAGITVGLDSYNQATNGVNVPIDPNYVEPGDLIFVRGDVPIRDLGHVAIAISNTQEIMAPHSGANVQVAPIPYDRVQRIRRIIT
jgi:hypothetical protein